MTSFLTSVFIFFTVSTFAKDGYFHQKNTIVWTEWSNPPIFINKGKYKGEGVSDKIQEFIYNKLKNVKHLEIDANIPRIIELAKKGTHTCNSSWIDTPVWRKVFYFSKPYMIVPTNGVIIKKSKRHLLGSSADTSLDKMIKNSKLSLGVARLYGEGIDEILLKYNYKRNPKVSVVSLSINAHYMLMNDRVDYILGYPFEVEYYKKNNSFI